MTVAIAVAPRREVVPFVAAHFVAVATRDTRQRMLAGWPTMDLWAHARELEAGSEAVTGLLDGLPFFCLGALRLWPGVAEAWAVTDDRIRAERRWLHRTARWAIGEAARRLQLRRLQAAIEVDHLPALRWARRLGFVEEGVMRRYGPHGEDAVRLARVFD